MNTVSRYGVLFTVATAALCLLLAGCSGALTAQTQLSTQATPEEAAARDDAAMRELLVRYNPDSNDWTKGPTMDAIINSYERTGNPEYLRVLERSFRAGRGWRSFDPNKLYYDDMAWYANAWLRAFDVTGDRHYLTEAQAIFDEMTTAWDDTCGGGVWWNADRQYKNAITNELFLLTAARLARRAPNRTGEYRDWASREWNWFKGSGMINAQGLVNDGLDGNCNNNGEATWSYNQGVILGGLVELWRLDGDRKHLASAERIAEAAIDTMTYPSGVFRDVCETFPDGCTGDALIFKGMFAQGLARLYNADRGNKPAYGDYLNVNADGIWDRSRTDNNALGVVWNGPVGTPSLQSHAAGTLLVGGVALLNAGGETSGPPTSSTYQAETAVLHDLGTESTHAGFSGGGYVAGWNTEGQWLDFKVVVPETRRYTLTVYYAAGAGDAGRLLWVNGSSRADNLSFAGTSSWETYNTVPYEVDLNAGQNDVSLVFSKASGSRGYLNLDRMDVQ